MARLVRPRRGRWTALLRDAEGGGRRHAWTFIVAAALLVASPPRWASAQVGHVSITLNGDVRFPDADPDVTPVIGPRIVTARVRVLTPNGTPWTLTMLAESDLRSGSDAIPAEAVSWTAAPGPTYNDGTLSTVVPALVGAGTAKVNQNVTLRFCLENRWEWNPGDYRTAVTLSLSSP